MAIGKEIKVVLTLDDKGFKVGIRDANGELKQFQQHLAQTAISVKKVESHFDSFGQKAHQVVMTMGMARFALMDLRDIFLSFPLAILKTAGEIERTTKLMEGLSTETDALKRRLEATSNVKFLFNMAQNAPLEIKALSDAFVKLKTGGLDPTSGSMQALVDGVAKFGGSSEQLKRAAVAIQQMGGKGVVSMEELRQQLGEAVPTAMESMAIGMRMSMAQLNDVVKKGTVEATSAMDKMLIVMGLQNAGAAAAMMDTWVGTLERLKTRWELFKNEVGAEGMFDGAKQAVNELIAAMGGANSGSFARSIGREMNDALVTVVNITKKIAEMWDVIILAGKAWAIYWAASKAAGPAQKLIDNINAARLGVIAKRDASIAAEAAENAAREAAARAEIPRFQERIRQNEALIAEELKRVAAQKAADAERVASTIKASQAEIAAARDKAAQLSLIEQEIRMRSMATALEAEKIARGKKAGSGADARRMIENAAGLANNADLLARERKALLDNATALGQRNSALQKSAEIAAISTSATNGAINALNQKNNALKQVVAQYEAQARGITQANSAMGLMGAAATSVVGWLKGMLTSMNSLTTAIMGAVWAWDYFSSKAKKAAQDAHYALNMAKLVERGKANREAVEGAKRSIESDKSVIAANDFEIQAAKSDPLYKHDKAMQARVADLEAKNKIIKDRITKAGKELDGGIKQVFEKDADVFATELQAGVDSVAAKAVKPFMDQSNRLIDEFKNLKNPTAEQQKKLNDDIHAQNLKALDAKRDALKSEAARYKSLTKEASKTEDEREGYRLISERLEKQAADVGAESIRLGVDNKFVAPKKEKKAPQNDPTDALLEKMNADERAVRQLKERLKKLTTEELGLVQLRADAQAEIDIILEQDKRRYVVHSPEDVAKAVEQLTNKKALLEAVHELSTLTPKLAVEKEKLRQLEDVFDDPDHRDKADNSEESKVLQLLEKVRKLSPDVEASVKKVGDELLGVARKVDVYGGLIEADKRIAALKVNNVVDARERIRAEYEKEVKDANWKYDQFTKAAEGNDKQLDAIDQRRAAELEEIAKKRAKALETPLNKLAREWENTTAQLNDATAKWSNGFLDEMSKMLTGAGGNWRKFLTGMLTDTLNMQLKKAFGDKTTGLFNYVGQKIGGLVGIGKAVVPATENAAAGTLSTVAGPAGTAAAKMFEDGVKKAGESASALGTGFADMTGRAIIPATTATINGIVQSTNATTAQATTTSALKMLTIAADEASVALKMMATSSGGGLGGGSSFFAQKVDGLSYFDFATAFADGGIMSSLGSVPLRKYATGGIANRPQLALFGEGSMNEAYVPLPDGRSIPVTMNVQGGMGGGETGTNVAINITVNTDGSEARSDTGGNERQAWNRMAEKVKQVVREELVVQQRPQGVLYR